MSANASIVWKDAHPSTVGALGPRCRWGHASVVVQARGGKERMLVLGKTGMSGHMLVFGYSAVDNTWGLINCGGNVPPLRSRHTASVVGGRNVYVFGGVTADSNRRHLNELWRLELATMTWHPVNTTGNTPAPRCYHSAVVHGKKIIYYGGEGANKEILREVVVFDTETNTWLPRIPLGNDGPEERYSHTAVLVGDRMFVYGGRSKRNTYGDLWSFSLADMSTWTRMPDREAPAPRYGHSSALINGVMWIVGGWSRGTRQRSSEVYAIDLANGDVSYGFRWLTPSVEGPVGTHRSRGTLQALGGKLVLYGGEAGNGIVLGDTMIIDVSAYMPRADLYTRWVHQCEFPSHAAAAETGDGSISFHLVTVAQSLYVIHCAPGVWKVSELDEASRTWHTHAVTGDLPRCVRGFALLGYAYGEDAHEHHIVVFGGVDEAGTVLNELVSLDVAKGRWQRAQYVRGMGPQPRAYHSMTLRGRELYVFGGGELPIEVMDVKTGMWCRPGERGKSKWGRRWFKRNRDTADSDAYWVPRKCEPDSVVWARSAADERQLLITNPHCHVYQWEALTAEWNRAVVSMCASRSNATVMMCEYDARAECHWVVQKDHSVHQIRNPPKSNVFVWDRASLGGGESVLAHLSMHSAVLLGNAVYSLLTNTRGTMFLYKLVMESKEEWMSKEEGRLIAEGVLEPNTLGGESMHTSRTCNQVGFGPDAVDEDKAPGSTIAGLCCVCMTSAVGVVLIPCGHACLCPNCCHLIEKCPICRSSVQRRQRLFFV